jgi:hypothetical protein
MMLRTWRSRYAKACPLATTDEQLRKAALGQGVRVL